MLLRNFPLLSSDYPSFSNGQKCPNISFARSSPRHFLLYFICAFSNELLGLELGLGKPQATRIFDKSIRVLRWSENRENQHTRRMPANVVAGDAKFYLPIVTIKEKWPTASQAFKSLT